MANRELAAVRGATPPTQGSLVSFGRDLGGESHPGLVRTPDNPTHWRNAVDSNRRVVWGGPKETVEIANRELPAIRGAGSVNERSLVSLGRALGGENYPGLVRTPDNPTYWRAEVNSNSRALSGFCDRASDRNHAKIS